MSNVREFMKGRIHVPFPLRGDAYSIAGDCLASPEARDTSIYNFTNRLSPRTQMKEVAEDSRMVFYGLSDFIREHMTQPINMADVDESVKFMAQAKSGCKPLKFNADMWRRVVTDCDGYLPIMIQAVPEGSVFFPNEPVIQVTSLGKGFGEIAAHIEALMVGMVSIASAKVTLYRHWLQRLRKYVLSTNPKDTLELAQWVIHDFGMRASSCAEESELLGRAHLLVFHGTDTFNAAYQAWKMGCHSITGKSILALAHRIVQGYSNEGDCYKNLISQDNIGSFVADCYNFKNAVKEYLIPLAQANRDNTIVVRPDSGNHLDNVEFIVTEAIKAGLSSTYRPYANSSEERTCGKGISFISGDSMNPSKVDAVMQMLNKMGCDPIKWGLFGVGGYGRNTPNRDILSSAYKLASKGNNIPVMKLSETLGKMSVPGPTYLLDPRTSGKSVLIKSTNSQIKFFKENHYFSDRMRTYYCYGRPIDNSFSEFCYEHFSNKQTRTIKEFDDYEKFSKNRPDYGMPNDTCLSDTILRMQKLLHDHYQD